MDNICNGKMSENGMHYVDFDWHDFVEKIFSQPPHDPFTFSMSFLDEINEKKLVELMGIMLAKGVKMKYNKEIAQLLPNEIDELQKYYRSIGYEVKYQIETKNQYVANLNKTVPVNFFQIDFQPYPRRHDRYNQPEKIL